MSFNLNYIRTFVVSGLLLLLCTLFNFINLQVNRIFERSREFKLRTSLGAVKKNLFCQIIIEISIQVLLALLVGVSLIELTTPYIEQLLDTSIQKSGIIHRFITDRNIRLDSSVINRPAYHQPLYP